MAGKVVPAPPSTSFEYEFLEADPENLRTIVETPRHGSPWVDPSTVKLRHRIGRGPFGDVWLATHHRSAQEYDEYHEVAVKMLHTIKDEHMKVLLDKFGVLFDKCHLLEGICKLHGITIISGKICLIMKFYEGSVGDKLSRQKGGKLPLANALRYGVSLAEGLVKLHSKGVLVLNIKPCSFVLTEDDNAIIGDVGIPYLLLGIPHRNMDAAQVLGTPNYMAPEQWHPEIRGPVSFETDSWGFGCSIVEMLTGEQPWHGLSVEDICHSVVNVRKTLQVPRGLPPEIENIIFGCFMYDFRNRPLMSDILNVFKSSQSAISQDEEGMGYCKSQLIEKSSNRVQSEWFLLKDIIQVGDLVRSRKPLNSCKPESMDIPEGKVAGLERNGFLLVKVHGIHDPLRVHTATIERVSDGLAAGDWVHLKEENKDHSSVGVVHSVGREGNVTAGFVGLEILWRGKAPELEMAESFGNGHFVRLRANILSPRFQWPRKTNGIWATGRICWILPNGCLIVEFPGMLFLSNEGKSFMADPAEVELVSFSGCTGLHEKYQHLEDFHWAVRPVLIAIGVFTLTKLGFLLGNRIRSGGKRSQCSGDGHQHMDGNQGWFRSRVANIIFKGSAGKLLSA